LALKPRIVRTFGGAAVCPLDHSYRQELANALDDFLIETEGCDALYWESPCLTPGFENNPSARDCLKSDLVIKELRMLEEILGCRTQLIYYLPASCFSEAAEQSEWMAELCDAAGKNTVIAFPAAGGQLSDDHAAPHPFWKELRRSPDISSTRLMPVINCGGIEQGEGLWPNLPMDLIQTYLPRCYRHTFAGIAIPCPALPGEGSFLEGALWIASQAQWRDLPAELLAETWHAARRPSEEYGESKIRLENIREVIKGISSLRQLVNQKARSLIPTAENRAKVERVIALIKLLDCQLSASGIPAMQDHPPTLDDYQLYFLRDAKRMTAYLAQHLSVPTPHLLQGQDLGEGFWTDIAYNAFRRDVPRQGNPGSKMARIFLENRFEF
jgi:hypothetical protein